MKISILKDKLIRRLSVNLVSHIGAPESTNEWTTGYEQAIHDAQQFLEQLEIYEPYNHLE
jgi:hypothetical protein